MGECDQIVVMDEIPSLSFPVTPILQSGITKTVRRRRMGRYRIQLEDKNGWCG